MGVLKSTGQVVVHCATPSFNDVSLNAMARNGWQHKDSNNPDRSQFKKQS